MTWGSVGSRGFGRTLWAGAAALLAGAVLLLVGCTITPEPSNPFSVGDFVRYWDDESDVPVRYVGRVVQISESACEVVLYRNGHQLTGRRVWVPWRSLFALSNYVVGKLEDIPNGYYLQAAAAHSQSTLERLEAVLREFRQRFRYEMHIYDCSNMSAYLEWALENLGFDARIAAGKVPWYPESTGRHAWVIVRTADGHVVAVETTSSEFSPRRVGGVVYPGDGLLYENYVLNGEYFVEYDTVHAFAATYWVTEYAWWWWMDDIFQDWPIVSIAAYEGDSLR